MRRGHAPVAAGDLVLQIMFINQRIKIRLPENESLAVFFQKVMRVQFSSSPSVL